MLAGFFFLTENITNDVSCVSCCIYVC